MITGINVGCTFVTVKTFARVLAMNKGDKPFIIKAQRQNYVRQVTSSGISCLIPKNSNSIPLCDVLYKWADFDLREVRSIAKELNLPIGTAIKGVRQNGGSVVPVEVV